MDFTFYPFENLMLNEQNKWEKKKLSISFFLESEYLRHPLLPHYGRLYTWS